MQTAAVFAALVAAALLVLYVVWRVRFRYPPAHSPQSLCFHKISRRFLWEGTWMTPHRFFTVIDHLRDRGVRFVGEDDYLAALDAAQAGAPEAGRSRDVFLTFDDGYAELRTELLDGLAARGIPLHVFVVSDYVGRTNDWDLALGRPAARHASWEELRDMAAAGATFGSHTARHRDLTRLGPADLDDELTRSRSAIEDALGVPVRTLSYPFGRYHAAARAAARAAGYAAAFSLYPRHSNERIDRYALRRAGVYVIDTPRTVDAKLRPGPAFWFEEMKGRAINAVAVITPMVTHRRRL